MIRFLTLLGATVIVFGGMSLGETQVFISEFAAGALTYATLMIFLCIMWNIDTNKGR